MLGEVPLERGWKPSCKHSQSSLVSYLPLLWREVECQQDKVEASLALQN